MANRSNEELAAAAAAWWADRMQSRTNKPRLGIGVVDAAASLASELPGPDADKVAAFRQHLEARIASALATSSGWLTVRMDYDPDVILSTAMEAAGIDPRDGVLDLPWKTTMDFRADQITVRSLGKPDEQI